MPNNRKQQFPRSSPMSRLDVYQSSRGEYAQLCQKTKRDPKQGQRGLFICKMMTRQGRNHSFSHPKPPPTATPPVTNSSNSRKQESSARGRVHPDTLMPGSFLLPSSFSAARLLSEILVSRNNIWGAVPKGYVFQRLLQCF